MSNAIELVPGGNIFKAISAIMAEVGAIGKDRKNASQNYQYRGIEDFYNVCQPLMVKNKVFSTSQILDERREERITKNGGVLIYAVLKMRYTFHTDDGSSVITEVMGEGMDSGDKASNKAMAVAHKYALAQMFAVPTQDMVDPEVDSPEPAPKTNSANIGAAPKSAPIEPATQPTGAPLGPRIDKLNQFSGLTTKEIDDFHRDLSKAANAVEQEKVVAGWEKDVASRKGVQT